jgi:predicted flap endonuclease-1-like 5' DNA nuclease
MRGVAYAAIEIIVLIVLAAIIGLLLGWILRKFLYDVDVSALEARITAAERARRVAEADAVTARAEVGSLEGRLEAAEQAAADAGERAGSLTADLDAALQDASTKEAALGRLEVELAAIGALRDQAEARAARVAELEVLVVERESADHERLAQLEEALRDARAAHEACAARLDERDSRIARLEAAASREVGAGPAMSGPPSRDEAVAAMAAIASRTAGGGPRADDDLKKIHGVGPKLERLLKSMGITSFAQIARFEAGDIATVTAALDAFPGRIERDDWMSSAAGEHEKKYGEPVPGR